MENLSFYRNKHDSLNREMTSSCEIGGAASIHVILCGHDMSLIKLKKMFELTESWN